MKTMKEKSIWYWNPPQKGGYSIEECEKIMMQDMGEIKRKISLLNARLRHRA